MKKIYLLFALVFAPFIGQSQSVFDVFEDIDDVTTVSVTKSAFRLMSKFGGSTTDPEAKAYMDMIKELDQLKVFVTEDEKIAGDMQKVANSYIKSSDLIELMRVKEKGSNVKIYVREGADEDHVKELLMFVTDQNEGNQAVIMSLTGNIDLNKVALLTEKMNLPAGTNITIE